MLQADAYKASSYAENYMFVHFLEYPTNFWIIAFPLDQPEKYQQAPIQTYVQKQVELGNNLLPPIHLPFDLPNAGVKLHY